VRGLSAAPRGEADSPAEGEGETLVLLGDLNSTSGVSLSPLRRHLEPTPRLRTFPSWRPLLPLDRIWVRPSKSLARLEVHRSELARQASDHLPLCAELALEPD